MRVLALIAALLFLSPALADSNIAMRTVIPAKPEHELLSKQFRDAVDSELARELEAAQARGCKAKLYDISKTILDGRETEKMLQDKGYSTGDAASPIGEIPVNTFVDGVVGTSNGEVDFILEVSGMDGKTSQHLEGSFKEDELFKKAEEIAKEIVEKLCKPKGYLVRGSYNDLVINQVVCDVSKPFTLRGSGATAGIRLALTPSGDKGGAFAVGGSAGGVPWSGGGTYDIALDEAGGKLNLTGAWRITTPVGVFGDAGTIKTILAAQEACEEKAAKPAAKPAKAKKKKKAK